MVAGPLTAADPAVPRGLKPLAVTAPDGRVVTTITSSQALIIGNSAYADGAWSPLAGVTADVAAVRTALETHGFAVTVAMDQTKAALIETIDGFVAEHGADPAGRVIIYYAGHGYTRGGAQGVGYLVPVDAPLPTDRQFTAKAYPIQQMKIKAAEITARHVLFAFDCCFGGSVFTPLRGSSLPTPLSEAAAPVRLFLTAGAADEQVPDTSFFRQEFVAGINGLADANRDGWVTGRELGFHLTQQVRDRARAAGMTLTPQAGVSEQEGFNRGDIIFRVPTPVVEQPTPVPTPPPVSAFTLDDVPRDDRQRAAWATWQQSMAAAFDQVRTMDADPAVGVPARRAAWQKFLDAFATDNPLTTDDEAMRATAMAALQRLASGSAPPGTPPTRPAPAPVAPAQPPAPQPTPPAATDTAEQRLATMVGRWVDAEAKPGLRLDYEVTMTAVSIINSSVQAQMADLSTVLRVTRERLRVNGGGLQFIGRSARGVPTMIELRLDGRQLHWTSGGQTTVLNREP